MSLAFAVFEEKSRLRALLDHFGVIEDPCDVRRVAHPLREVPLLVVCGQWPTATTLMRSPLGERRICRSCAVICLTITACRWTLADAADEPRGVVTLLKV